MSNQHCIVTSNSSVEVEIVCHYVAAAPPKMHGTTGASGSRELEEYSYSQGQTAVLSCSADVVPEYTDVIWTKSTLPTLFEL